jgi:hypothetical protein
MAGKREMFKRFIFYFEKDKSLLPPNSQQKTKPRKFNGKGICPFTQDQLEISAFRCRYFKPILEAEKVKKSLRRIFNSVFDLREKHFAEKLFDRSDLKNFQDETPLPLLPSPLSISLVRSIL